MNSNRNSVPRPSSTGPKPIGGWLLLAALLGAFVALVAAVAMGQAPKGLTRFEHVGAFGDFVGGLLNPLIAAVALGLLWQTYSLQKTELKETREALEKQSIRQTFFDLLQQHRELVNGVQLEANQRALVKDRLLEGAYTGRASFAAVVMVLGSAEHNPVNSEAIAKESADAGFICASEESFRQQLLFARWYQGENGGFADVDHLDGCFPLALEMSFGHVFRSTFQILKFAHTAPGLSPRERRDLVNYLRAQMSEDEFVLFALSALTKIGEKSRAASIAFDFFQNRMNTVEWAAPMRQLLTSSPDNLEFAAKLGFTKVE